MSTPRRARQRATLMPMTRNSIFTGTPYIGVAEIADRARIRPASVRSQMRAMRQRKKDPVDMRVPVSLMPDDVGHGQTLYWRDDVDQWLREREARAAGRGIPTSE